MRTDITATHYPHQVNWTHIFLFFQNTPGCDQENIYFLFDKNMTLLAREPQQNYFLVFFFKKKKTKQMKDTFLGILKFEIDCLYHKSIH